MASDAEAGDPPAVTALNEAGRSHWVLLCEHASRHIPPRFGKLGLPDHELARHIAWDIGAEGIARALSASLDAALFLSGYSRLLIDNNRPVGVPSSIPEVSETTEIPGNRGLSAQARHEREDLYYWPFQKAVAAHLDARQKAGRATIIFGVHTFTPVFKGVRRPWHAGVLFRKSERLGLALLDRLQEPGLVLAANEPYTIEDDHDQTVPVHGEARGLDAVLIEVRQDLVADTAGQAEWADRLARALNAIS